MVLPAQSGLADGRACCFAAASLLCLLPPISFWGQAIGALTFAALGFIPAYLVSLLLKTLRVLRIPPEVEEQGLDLAEVPATPYPEGIPVTAMRVNANEMALATEVK